MLCLSGFELYSRRVPLKNHTITYTNPENYELPLR